MSDHPVDLISQHIKWLNCPEKFRGGIQRWVFSGIPPGSFLMAVLENDLLSAYQHADRESIHQLHPLMSFFHNEMPARSYEICWGSPDICRSWKMQRSDERSQARVDEISCEEPSCNEQAICGLQGRWLCHRHFDMVLAQLGALMQAPVAGEA